MAGKNKKGLTQKTIVLFIIAIISFLILVSVVYLLYFNDLSETQACAAQIELRDTANGIGRNIVPLTACSAKHICFVTSKKESCPELNFNDVQEIVVANKEDIVKNIAEMQRTCWKMTGEGTKDYNAASVWGWKTKFCGICDKIYFSKQLSDKISQIENKFYFDYLDRTVMPDTKDVTYSQYLFKQIFMNQREVILRERPDLDIYEGSINLSQGYMIYTAEYKDTWAKELAIPFTIGVVTVVTIGTGGAGALGFVILFGIGTTGGALIQGAGAQVVGYNGKIYDPPTLTPYTPDYIKSTGCDLQQFQP